MESSSVMNPEQRLPHLESLLMASVLETALSKLAILDRCPHSRFDTTQNVPSIHKATTDEATLEKMKSDLSSLALILAVTHKELITNGTFTTFLYRIQLLANQLEQSNTIESENASLKRERRQLAEDLRQIRTRRKSAVYDSDVETALLIDCFEDEVLNSDIRFGYTARWTSARVEQLAVKCAREEAALGRRAHEQRQATEHERRVHVEMCAAVDVQIKDDMEKIGYWIDKYHMDLKEIEERVRHQRSRCEVVLIKRRQLTDTFNTHKEQIDKRKQELEERRIRQELEEKARAAAIKVQAWWRGMLVRCQLGPFHRITHTKQTKKSGKKK